MKQFLTYMVLEEVAKWKNFYGQSKHLASVISAMLVIWPGTPCLQHLSSICQITSSLQCCLKVILCIRLCILWYMFYFFSLASCWSLIYVRRQTVTYELDISATDYFNTKTSVSYQLKPKIQHSTDLPHEFNDPTCCSNQFGLVLCKLFPWTFPLVNKCSCAATQ